MKTMRNQEKGTWLLIEPTLQGHHSVYARELLRQGLNRKVKWIVAVSDDATGASLEKYLAAEFPEAGIKFIKSPVYLKRRCGHSLLSLVLGEIRFRQFFKDVYNRACKLSNIDHVLIPYLDYAMFAMGVCGSPFGRTSFSGITMRQRFHLGRMGVGVNRSKLDPIKSFLFGSVLKMPTLTKLIAIDPTLVEYCNLTGMRHRKKVRFVSDPVVNGALADRPSERSNLGVDEGTAVVLLYGSLDVRKGVLELLNWACREDNKNKVKVLLCGVITDELRSLIENDWLKSATKQEKIEIRDQYLDDEQEAKVVAAADFIWLGYRNFPLMSGVLAKAAVAGKKVIINKYGLIEYYCQRYGFVDESTKHDEIALALDKHMAVVAFRPTLKITTQSHSWDTAGLEIFEGN
jgi:hypothetical protein